MQKIILNGITWGHSRGLTPLVAASQRYCELHPNIDITWKKRTLQEFADFPIEKLTESYDLLIIDHPWVGCASATRCVIPLDKYIQEDYLSEQAGNSVGASHHSYEYDGSQWALAIDAATPVASYRSDLFDLYGERLPDTWEEVLSLARKGRVILPGIAIDTLMCFYAFCISNGSEPFKDGSMRKVVDEETGTAALEQMQSLWKLCDPCIFHYNPIAVAERMTQSDDFWYCPFAYGYSNYARKGYAPHLLSYTGTVRMNGQQRLRTTLGGTGLSVSSFSKHQREACAFAQWIVSPDIQSTLYAEHGGQPGHRSAWLSDSNNRLTNDYFKNTLATLDDAYVRPRYNGYLHFQDLAGDPIRDFLKDGGKPGDVLKRINEIYLESLAIGK